MSTTTATERAARPAAETTSARILRALNRAPIHIALGIIALIWLLPTIGLLVTSFRPRGDIQNSGWWTTFGQLPPHRSRTTSRSSTRRAWARPS